MGLLIATPCKLPIPHDDGFRQLNEDFLVKLCRVLARAFEIRAVKNWNMLPTSFVTPIFSLLKRQLGVGITI